MRQIPRRKTHWGPALALYATFACFLSTGVSAQAAGPESSDPPAAAIVPSGEPPPAPVSALPAGYSETIEAALREHERGNYQEARVHFQRAHELYPNARTLRGLGKVEYELRNYGEAARLLELSLGATARPLDSGLRAETERLLRRARVYVGEVHVDVQPGSATVSVDGVTVASGPRASISLLVGEHILEFRAQGRLSERRSIQVRGGEQTVIQVVLPEPEQKTAPLVATAAAPQRDEATPWRKKWWVWTAVGVIAVGVAVGVAVASKDGGSERPEATGGTSGVTLGGR